MSEESIIVGSRIVKGRVHCAWCGKYVKGNVFVITKEGSKFVCKIQCGINYIAKKSRGVKE